LLALKKNHKDDIAPMKILIGFDDCQVIKKIGNCEIELILEENWIEKTNNPDWYGYKRIDKIKKSMESLYQYIVCLIFLQKKQSNCLNKKLHISWFS